MNEKDFGHLGSLSFLMGKGVGWRPWVNVIWSSPDFRVIIYDGNGHISPAREKRFEFYHIFSHPTDHLMFQRLLKGFFFHFCKQGIRSELAGYSGKKMWGRGSKFRQGGCYGIWPWCCLQCATTNGKHWAWYARIRFDKTGHEMT